MFVVDYGGRAPDPAQPHDGAVQAWDLSARVHHDYSADGDVERPFTPEELDRFADQLADIDAAQILAQIAAEITTLTGLMGKAGTRATQADNLRITVEGRRTTVQGWTPTAASATDLATLRARTVADLGVIRDEIGTVYGALGTTLAGLSETYSGLREAYAELIGLAKLAAREVASR